MLVRWMDQIHYVQLLTAQTCEISSHFPRLFSSSTVQKLNPHSCFLPAAQRTLILSSKHLALLHLLPTESWHRSLTPHLHAHWQIPTIIPIKPASSFMVIPGPRPAVREDGVPEPYARQPGLRAIRRQPTPGQSQPTNGIESRVRLCSGARAGLGWQTLQFWSGGIGGKE